MSEKLLKRAAKAAGITGIKDCAWNPLDNDGDALRLAVKLRLVIAPPTEYSNLVYVAYPGGGVCENGKDDPYAATRRAIVRAATRLKKT